MTDSETLFHARYRDPAQAAPPEWNAALQTMLGHRSVRAFLPDPVPVSMVQAAVAAASSAPTSSNLQTWSVIAVEDAARRDRLRALGGGQRFINDAPLLLMWIADLSRIHALAEERQQRVDGINYLEVTFVAIIDAALAAQNALVALESMGLGTVYIGGMRNKPEAVAAELGLPKRAFAVFGMSVGWPDPAVATAVKPRLPQSAILHRETYDTTRQLPAVADYDPRMTAFQEEQGMAPEIWTQRVINRVRDAAALNGRDRMREALGALGFELR
jgi:nitroreductase